MTTTIAQIIHTLLARLKAEHAIAEAKMVAARDADYAACRAFADRTETFAAYRTAERARRVALGKLTKAERQIARLG